MTAFEERARPYTPPECHRLNLYFISVKPEFTEIHDVQSLARAIDELPGVCSVVDGEGEEVVTVEANQEAITAARSFNFLDVEDYFELKLLPVSFPKQRNPKLCR